MEEGDWAEFSLQHCSGTDVVSLCLFSFRRFTSIQSIEQRREYKSIFDKDYAEYRKLHEQIDNVSKRFAQLEEKLRMEEKSRKDSSKVKVRSRRARESLLCVY